MTVHSVMPLSVIARERSQHILSSRFPTLLQLLSQQRFSFHRTNPSPRPLQRQPLSNRQPASTPFVMEPVEHVQDCLTNRVVFVHCSTLPFSGERGIRTLKPITGNTVRLSHQSPDTARSPGYGSLVLRHAVMRFRPFIGAPCHPVQHLRVSVEPLRASVLCNVTCPYSFLAFLPPFLPFPLPALTFFSGA